MMNPRELKVLSLSYTRSLFREPADEDARRIRAYADGVGRYTVIVNTYRRDSCVERWIGPTFRAIPTGGYSPADNWVRMLALGGRALSVEKYSIVQAQDPVFTGSVAMCLGRRFKLPVNVCVYGPNPYDKAWRAADLQNRLLAPVARTVLSRAEGVQVDGRLTMERLIAAGVPAGRVRLKPMVPSQLETFFGVSRAERADGKPVRILFVGRLHGQKRVDVLLEAFCAVSSPAELWVIGDGPERARLAALTRRLKLSDRVHFLGQQSVSDVQAAMADADIFALSSAYEGYPRVLMEAAAAGLPIVSTDVSGAAEAIRHGVSGFIAPISDVGALARGLVTLASDPGLRLQMGTAGRRLIAEALRSSAPDGQQIDIWLECVTRTRRLHA